MAYTAIKKKMLAAMPVEERERTLKIERMERNIARKKSRGEIIGLTAAYDKFVADWRKLFDKVNRRG